MSEYLKRLKELRLTKGISQKEIAEYYNVSLDDLLEMNGTPTLPAVRFDGSGFTEEEMKEILQFAEFIKSKRSEKPVVEYSIRQDSRNG